jgi:ABC-2 type transport system ATP-binding protein
MIEIKEVSVQFPRVLAVDNITCAFKNGLIHGLIGPNGAGKSTLLKTLVGLISNYSGQVFYGSLLLSENRQAIKKQFGYAPEDIELIPYLSGLEYLQMVADIRKLDNKAAGLAGLLQILGLEEVQDKMIDSYSHGMRQKLSLAAALAGFPEVLILDEALNGLDTLALINVKKLLRELAAKGHTVILSSHILELVEQWCDEIYIMDRGKLLSCLDSTQLQEIYSGKRQSLSAYFQELITARPN